MSRLPPSCRSVTQAQAVAVGTGGTARLRCLLTIIFVLAAYSASIQLLVTKGVISDSNAYTYIMFAIVAMPTIVLLPLPLWREYVSVVIAYVGVPVHSRLLPRASLVGVVVVVVSAWFDFMEMFNVVCIARMIPVCAVCACAASMQ